VLVNVAGIGVAATVLETSDEDWNRVLAVNLTGPFLTTRAILPLMLDRGNGVIVNIASVAGQVGVPRRAAYCASKAGLVGLTKAIAVDHAHEGIRSVAICPGTVETEWIGKILANAPDPAATRAAMAARQLDGRMERRGRSPPWSPCRRPGGPVHQRNSPHRRWRDDGGMSAATVAGASAIGADLARIVGAANVEGRPTALVPYRTDATFGFSGIPRAVVRPGSTDEVSRSLRWRTSSASRWCSRRRNQPRRRRAAGDPGVP